MGQSENYWLKLGSIIDTTKPLHILSCLFAQPREEWETRVAGFEPFFKKAFGERSTIELAFPKRFRKQVTKADVIYLHGGDSELLSHYLDAFADLRQLFEGKIVIGSSAGASYLSAHYWSVSWRESKKGSGLTPLNVIVHYGSSYGKDDPRGPIDWEKAEQELQTAIGPNETITKLPEGEFVEFTTG